MDTKDYILAISLIEGSTLLLSWAASAEPDITGGILVLTAPISVGMSSSGKMGADITNLVAIESLAIYNLTLDRNKKSKSDIFIENMIGWHIVYATFAISEYIFDDPNESLSIRSISSEGIEVAYNYSF